MKFPFWSRLVGVVYVSCTWIDTVFFRLGEFFLWFCCEYFLCFFPGLVLLPLFLFYVQICSFYSLPNLLYVFCLKFFRFHISLAGVLISSTSSLMPKNFSYISLLCQWGLPLSFLFNFLKFLFLNFPLFGFSLLILLRLLRLKLFYSFFSTLWFLILL